jgi:putative chitinase
LFVVPAVGVYRYERSARDENPPMSIITEARLTAFLPTLPNVAIWARALDEAMERFEIHTPERMAAFLAQIAHESSEFRRLVESLNYTGSRLMKVWPKRFQTLEKANEYARQPEKLANYVYAKRLGNGDVASGDGWRYRGRGLIQLTGRANYQTAGRALSRPFEIERVGRAARRSGAHRRALLAIAWPQRARRRPQR